ncbi:DUF2254 domain-containing protein [Paludisphaera sp.]|uniref:DUF2254 domain-containing protein n=1 Tax=Paludisphaera sp. TaxID=2017432 RepID=UPI00301C57AF
MKLWFVSRWESLRGSFWFLPTVMVAGAMALSLFTLRLDRATPDYSPLAAMGWTFAQGPEGSRAVLAAVVGSMMGITSVTFSIMIVALQLASSQFGPRLLRNFMRDRGSQAALGTFLATFTYCLLILRTVNGAEGERFVPNTSVTVGLGLALASLGVFIFFIHHAAASIQAENIISSVSRELDRAIDRLYPEGTGDEAEDPRDGGRDVPEAFDREAEPVASRSSDYLQAVDLDGLMALAVERDLIISIPSRPGKFVFEGGELALAWPPGRLRDGDADAIRAAFYLGARRSPTQDVEFAIDQLVEVALRAAPNDPFTVINCIDRIGAGLCRLAARRMPSPYRHDGEGRLRLIADRSTAAGIVDAAFNQIRQATREDAAVSLRLLECIASVGRRARNPEMIAALRRQAELIHHGAVAGLAEAADRSDADSRYVRALRSLVPAKSPPGEVGEDADGAATSPAPGR